MNAVGQCQHVCAQGFVGLDRLGQQISAEYVLAAFSAAAGEATAEQLCRLGRDILMTGARQKALWDIFAVAADAALRQLQQQDVGEQQGNIPDFVEAELRQLLHFCGRTN